MAEKELPSRERIVQLYDRLARVEQETAALDDKLDRLEPLYQAAVAKNLELQKQLDAMRARAKSAENLAAKLSKENRGEDTHG